MRGTWLVASSLLVALAMTSRADDAATPTVVSLTQSARTKLAAGDATGAVADLGRAIELAPANPSLRHERATCRAKLADVKGTVEDLRAAEKLAPKEYAIDTSVWREAVELSRAQGGSKDPDLGLIQAEVAAIRGKPFKAAVESGAQTPEDFGKMVDASIDEEMPRLRRDDVTAGLHRLGLLPETFDVKKAVTGALMSQAAAYYDPRKKKFFNLIGDMPPIVVEATAAHELVHALQDQYFDLDRWMSAGVAPVPESTEAAPRDDDRVLALRCVVEGEATLVQTVWQLESQTHATVDRALAQTRMVIPVFVNLEVEELTKMVQANASLLPQGSGMQKAIDDMQRIEPYVLVPLMGAYFDGANLCQLVQSEGGWEAIDALYADPPQSSEQCLHPEKFVDELDRPTRVKLPELPEIAAAGWRPADLAIHGELYFRVLFRREGVKSKDARKAAAGWDGDVYAAWRSAAGETAVVLATAWDTERDAKEFFDAWRSSLATKYEKLAPEPGATDDALRFGCGEKLGTGALFRRGRDVFAVEGFAADLRETVAARLLAMTIEHVE